MAHTRSGLAVELYFDSDSRSILHDLLTRMDSSLLAMNGEPHVSLSVHDRRDEGGLIELVDEFASTVQPIGLQLASVGTFPTSEGVVFIAPVVTAELLGLHAEFHRRLVEGGIGTWDYYRPGQWVPHMTVELDLDRHLVGPTIEEYCRQFPRITAQASEIGIIEFLPIRQRFRKSVGGDPNGRRQFTPAAPRS